VHPERQCCREQGSQRRRRENQRAQRHPRDRNSVRHGFQIGPNRASGKFSPARTSLWAERPKLRVAAVLGCRSQRAAPRIPLHVRSHECHRRCTPAALYHSPARLAPAWFGKYSSTRSSAFRFPDSPPCTYESQVRPPVIAIRLRLGISVPTRQTRASP
jgi:hypothetical protein